MSTLMLVMPVSAIAETAKSTAVEASDSSQRTAEEGAEKSTGKSTVTDPAGISAGEGAVLDPRIERRRVKEAQIDAENFEVGVYAGLISLEDFGVDTLTGVHAAYHISEDIFFEGAIAVAKGGETNFERLNSGVQLLSDEDREFRTWHFDVGYQLLPGESFLGASRAFNTGLYLIGGAGSTTFGGDDHFTINVGTGYRVLLTDWLSMRLEMRDYIYEIDTFGEDQVTQNLAWTLGLSGFF
jgi:outer membrane beta-barrel protein